MTTCLLTPKHAAGRAQKSTPRGRALLGREGAPLLKDAATNDLLFTVEIRLQPIAAESDVVGERLHERFGDEHLVRGEEAAGGERVGEARQLGQDVLALLRA